MNSRDTQRNKRLARLRERAENRAKYVNEVNAGTEAIIKYDDEHKNKERPILTLELVKQSPSLFIYEELEKFYASKGIRFIPPMHNHTIAEVIDKATNNLNIYLGGTTESAQNMVRYNIMSLKEVMSNITVPFVTIPDYQWLNDIWEKHTHDAHKALSKRTLTEKQQMQVAAFSYAYWQQSDAASVLASVFNPDIYPDIKPGSKSSNELASAQNSYLVIANSGLHLAEAFRMRSNEEKVAEEKVVTAPAKEKKIKPEKLINQGISFYKQKKNREQALNDGKKFFVEVLDYYRTVLKTEAPASALFGIIYYHYAKDQPERITKLSKPITELEKEFLPAQIELWNKLKEEKNITFDTPQAASAAATTATTSTDTILDSNSVLSLSSEEFSEEINAIEKAYKTEGKDNDNEEDKWVDVIKKKKIPTEVIKDNGKKGFTKFVPVNASLQNQGSKDKLSNTQKGSRNSGSATVVSTPTSSSKNNSKPATPPVLTSVIAANSTLLTIQKLAGINSSAATLVKSNAPSEDSKISAATSSLSMSTLTSSESNEKLVDVDHSSAATSIESTLSSEDSSKIPTIATSLSASTLTSSESNEKLVDVDHSSAVISIKSSASSSAAVITTPNVGAATSVTPTLSSNSKKMPKVKVGGKITGVNEHASHIDYLFSNEMLVEVHNGAYGIYVPMVQYEALGGNPVFIDDARSIYHLLDNSTKGFFDRKILTGSLTQTNAEKSEWSTLIKLANPKLDTQLNNFAHKHIIPLVNRMGKKIRDSLLDNEAKLIYERLNSKVNSLSFGV